MHQQESGTTPEVTIQIDLTDTKSAGSSARASRADLYAATKCAYIGCNTEFVPAHWNQKFCDLHKRPPKGANDKSYEAQAQKRSKQKKAVVKTAEAVKYTSTVVLTKSAAKEVLSERIVNSHVVDVCYDLGVLAAERHSISANQFFWTNGLQKTLKTVELNKPELLDIRYDEEVDGETIHRGDLFGLYDFSISWREKISFEEFIALRYVCKTDALQLGWILGKDFHEYPDGPHGAWRDFYPQLKPTLKPGYTQEGMKEWLAAQDPVKDRLLLASRNAYKSSWNIVWLLTVVLCCADIRLLLVSETTKLSKGFIRGFRSYFEITNKRQPTRFQQLFPEHMIPPGDGSVLFFESPMRTLNLIQFTAEATSMDSTVAGQRADILVFDDPISDRNTGTDDTRQKGIDTFDATQKLREVGGYTVIIGTPWHVEDLYATLIRRPKADEESSDAERMLIRIDPAWTVKPDASHKQLRQLVEQDVDLLFPSRLTWKFLQKELRANETFFRSQNLCEFVSDEDQIKVTFTEEDLRARLRGLTAFDKSSRVFTILAVDPAFSIARYADFSALAVIRTHQHEDRTIAFVADVALERMKQSELGVKIVEMIQRHQADRVVIEKTGPWLDLQAHVHNAALVRSAILPHIFWKQNQAGIGGPSIKAKAGRIKGLEVLLAENRLYFAFGVWNDVVFNQFIKFDGVSRSNNTRKDDAPDAIALGCEVFVPRYQSEVKTALQEQAEDEMRVQSFLQGQYARVFGDQQPLTQSRYTTPPPDEPDGLHRTLGRFGMVRAA